jgi:hypothetical protein
MPSSNAALDAVLVDNRREYARHGVTCLRGLFDPAQVAVLAEASLAVIEHPLEHGGAGYMQGPMTAVNFLYRRPGPFRDFALGSRAGEIIGRVIGSRTIRMYHDYVFSKQPGCAKVVPWHTDGGGYALSGQMMPNLWVALTTADETNGRLEFIGGFHEEFVAKRWSERRKSADSIDQALPDFDDPDDAYAKGCPRLAGTSRPGTRCCSIPTRRTTRRRTPRTRPAPGMRCASSATTSPGASRRAAGCRSRGSTTRPSPTARRSPTTRRSR